MSDQPGKTAAPGSTYGVLDPPSAATASAPRPPDCNARPMAVVFTASAHCSMEHDSKDQTGPVTFVQVKRYTASPENG